MSAYRQTGPYIPDRDGDFREWLENFAEMIQVNPSRYGLTTADATVITSIWKQYRDAYKVISSPSTRTSSAIAFKDAIKASAKASIRTYAGLIRSNMGIDNQTLVELGMKPRNNSRSRIGPPQSAPLLAVVCGFALETFLRYADENTPASRRKPPGVLSLQVNVAVTPVGGRPTIDPNHAHFAGLFTKQPVLISHESQDAGKTAVFFGRWVTARGLTGPWSLPAYFTICAGGSAGQGDLLAQMRVPEHDAIRREKDRRRRAA